LLSGRPSRRVRRYRAMGGQRIYAATIDGYSVCDGSSALFQKNCIQTDRASLAGLAGTATRAVPVCFPFPADAFRADHPNPVPMTAAGAFAFYSSEQLCSEPLSWNGWLNYACAHHGRDILRIFKDPLALPGGAMPACICFYCGAIRTGEPCNGSALRTVRLRGLAECV
jgi:hypothetical protein